MHIRSNHARNLNIWSHKGMFISRKNVENALYDYCKSAISISCISQETPEYLCINAFFCITDRSLIIVEIQLPPVKKMGRIPYWRRLQLCQEQMAYV